jgi:catalase
MAIAAIKQALDDPASIYQTPVHIPTLAGGAESVDTPRDVRGVAVKFYSKKGNWDLVGNNLPVFIFNAIKFPDLIYTVKMEPDRCFPQSATAQVRKCLPKLL